MTQKCYQIQIDGPTFIHFNVMLVIVDLKCTPPSTPSKLYRKSDLEFIPTWALALAI
jgi:hypothetical protein